MNASAAKAATATGSDHGPAPRPASPPASARCRRRTAGAPNTKTTPTPPNSTNDTASVRHAWASMFERKSKSRRIRAEVACSAAPVKRAKALENRANSG
jgi:hypothetical protein